MHITINLSMRVNYSAMTDKTILAVPDAAAEHPLVGRCDLDLRIPHVELTLDEERGLLPDSDLQKKFNL